MASSSESSSPQEDKVLVEKVTETFLNLEEIDPLLYRSTHLFTPVRGRAVFGGQVVGQALVAASKTVSVDRDAHSLHCYFLRPGQMEQPILYHVKESRDGQTYSNRFVDATQNGKSIFTMIVSFKKPESDNFSHQFIMPDVPPPDECMEMNELLKLRLKGDSGKKERDYIEHRLTQEVSILRKPVDPSMYFNSHNEPLPAKQLMWIKTKGHIGDNQPLQKCAAAFITDTQLIHTAILPSGQMFGTTGNFFITSVDHAIWFHHPVRTDQWLLYQMESPQCGSGKALCHGKMWDQSGKLVISVAQEGAVRFRDKKWQGTNQGPHVESRRQACTLCDAGGSGSNPEATGTAPALQVTAVRPAAAAMPRPSPWVGRWGHSALLMGKRMIRLL